jgi:hypothetical protein
MKKITSREKTFLWATAGVAFVLFNYLVVWNWVGDAIERHRALAALHAEAGLQTETIAHTNEWEQEIKSLKALTKAGSSADDTEWLRRLEEMAKKSGLSLSSQRPIPEKKTAFGAESGVNYSIESNQEALVRFLFALQKDPASPQVSVLQISPENPAQDKLRVDATILVTRFNL